MSYNPDMEFISMMHCVDSYELLWINTLRPSRNGHHFPDDISKRAFLYENARILIKISLNFVPRGPINNISALVQIMAWCWSGNKPLSEPIIVKLPMHICVTRPQWVKPLMCGKCYMLYMMTSSNGNICNVTGPLWGVQHSKYHGCWCPGSLHCQAISSNDIDYVE